MSTLLHIQASPMGEESTSRRIAEVFLRSYAEIRPGDRIETLDLSKADLPEMDATAVHAQNRVIHRDPMTREERASWSRVVDACERFKEAHKVLLSCPMWNFHIPYRLKHYIDVITQPGITFAWSPETGYTGLVTGRPVQLIVSRAGAYKAPAEKAAMDYQVPYLDFIFRFLGFTDVRTIIAEPMLLNGPEAAARGFEEALDTARLAGRMF